MHNKLFLFIKWLLVIPKSNTKNLSNFFCNTLVKHVNIMFLTIYRVCSCATTDRRREIK